jgi:cellobiose-specific phosphotransferase system component IIB
MNEKQLKQKYEQGLDKLDLTDSEREAFDHDAKRSLIDLDTYQETDTFSLQGYKLSKVMDDIVLAQYVDLSNDGRSVIRNGIHIPLSQVKRTWRLARVVLVGPQCKYTSPGDVVCFPDDKGIKVDNLRVVGYDQSLRDCLFLNEQRFFGICQDLDDDDNQPSKS